MLMMNFFIQPAVIIILIYIYEWKNFRSSNAATKWAFSLFIAAGAVLWILMRLYPLMPRLGHLFKYIHL